MREFLIRHDVSTAYERGWSVLTNGDLLDVAEREGFEILITTDKNLGHQQNLDRRRIAIVVLATTSWPRIRREISTVLRAIADAHPGSYTEIAIP